jgi:hypothetical protein
VFLTLLLGVFEMQVLEDYEVQEVSGGFYTVGYMDCVLASSLDATK